MFYHVSYLENAMEQETPMKQTTLDRIRGVNKYVTNKILMHISGKTFGTINKEQL